MVKIDNEDFESVSLTAIITAYPRIFTDIPYSQEFYDEIKKENTSDIILKDDYAPEMETRYKLIDKQLKESEITQVLELAAGYSPRGLILAKNSDVIYVELDLEKISQHKSSIINRITEKPNNLHIIAGNALNIDDIKKCIEFFDKTKPIVIICEGLLRYLSFDERKLLGKIIMELLNNYNGKWITCDLATKTKLAGNEVMAKINENLLPKVPRGDLSTRFENPEHFKSFFEEIGFNIQFHTYEEVANDLVSPDKLKMNAEQKKNLIDKLMVAVMTVGKDKK